MSELFTKTLANYKSYRFLNTKYGYYPSVENSYWIEINNGMFVTKELMFECLSPEDKLTFMFNLNQFEHIKNHPRAFKTKEEVINALEREDYLRKLFNEIDPKLTNGQEKD